MDITIDQFSVPAISQSLAEHAVDAAIPVLPKLHLKPDLYKATVDDWEGTYRVSFIDKTAEQDGTLGNPGHIPGIQVKIDRKTFRVIRYGIIK